MLVISDGKTLPGSEKLSLKTLYEMFKDTKSHGLVSLQFLSALNIFFGGSVDLSRDTITGLYNNLLFEALSRQQNLIFEKNFDLIADISFSMKRFILSTVTRQASADEAIKKQKKNMNFLKKQMMMKSLKNK